MMQEDTQQTPAQVALSLPEGVLPLLPMRNLVLFPHTAIPVTVGRPRSVAALQQAFANAQGVGVLLQTDAHAEEPGMEGLCKVGCIATLHQYARTSDGLHHVVCQGERRFRLLSTVAGYPFLAGRIEPLSEIASSTPRSEALVVQLRERALELMALWPAVPADIASQLQATSHAGTLADIAAGLLNGESQDRQQLLETLEDETRLDLLLQRLVHRIQVLRLSQEIAVRTREQLEGRQREVLLREQLKTIQRELGEDEPPAAEDLGRLTQAIEAAALPAEVMTQVNKDLARLKRLGDNAGEQAQLRNYLERVSELPWAEPAVAPIDLKAARQVLDAEHHGLASVHQRVIEFLAVQKLRPNGRAPILCLLGPPGVGKTSLGQSIARALGRPFVRVALGGLHDEAEIRGHRRTYMGAMPGAIMQGMRRAGARHCVMMLDEIDKLGRGGVHGDPAAALLEVLDPEQNAAFRDNYLGLPFDLSRVFFIATANVLDPIAPALRDRLEVIELSGYTAEEKLDIARRFLLPRQREQHGLTPDQGQVSDKALQRMVAAYTHEAGVRQLEREISRLMRQQALLVAQGETPTAIDELDLAALLGPPRYEMEQALRVSLPGVATGLAWTPVGGDILFIEATRTAGTGKLILTGQLGDVMKESAQAALTLLKSMAPEMNVAALVFDGSDVHLHVPAGAIPKDGPSAGVAMFVALASLFLQRPVRHDVAMTGEISLRGLVLPVGGVREKLLAAERAGIRTVMLPARNEKDLQDLPPGSLDRLALVWLRHVDDALRTALLPAPASEQVAASASMAASASTPQTQTQTQLREVMP